MNTPNLLAISPETALYVGTGCVGRGWGPWNFIRRDPHSVRNVRT